MAAATASCEDSSPQSASSPSDVSCSDSRRATSSASPHQELYPTCNLTFDSDFESGGCVHSPVNTDSGVHPSVHLSTLTALCLQKKKKKNQKCIPRTIIWFIQCNNLLLAGNLARVKQISSFEYDLYIRPDTGNAKYVPHRVILFWRRWFQ